MIKNDTVTLLTSKEIEEYSTILEELYSYNNINSYNTDLAKVLGCTEVNYENPYSNNYIEKFKNLNMPLALVNGLKLSKTQHNCNRISKACKEFTEYDDSSCCIRPVIKFNSQTVLDNIKEINKDVKLVKYGQYPQEVASIDIANELENLYKNNKLEKTNKCFTLDVNYFSSQRTNINKLKKTSAYNFNDEMYIRIKSKKEVTLSNNQTVKNGQYVWIHVSEVEWYLINNTLISKNNLMSGINYAYGFKFENTGVYNYLNYYFLPEIEKGNFNYVQGNADESELIETYAKCNIPMYFETINDFNKIKSVIKVNFLDVEQLISKCKKEYKDLGFFKYCLQDIIFNQNSLNILVIQDSDIICEELKNILEKLEISKIKNFNLMAIGQKSVLIEKLGENLVSQLTKINIAEDINEWLSKRNVNPIIYAYIKYKTTFENKKFNKNELNKYEYASNILNKTNRLDLIRPLIKDYDDFINFCESKYVVDSDIYKCNTNLNEKEKYLTTINLKLSRPNDNIKAYVKKLGPIYEEEFNNYQGDKYDK